MRGSGATVSSARAEPAAASVSTPARTKSASGGCSRTWSEDCRPAKRRRRPREETVRTTADGGRISDLSFRLRAALDDLDEPAAQGVLDDLFGGFSLDAALTEVLIPYLRDLGARWQTGEVSVATEHFASNLVRGRLLALARGWGRGAGPLAMLAGPPGERHDIGLDHVRPAAPPARMADLVLGRGHTDRRPRDGRPIAGSEPSWCSPRANDRRLRSHADDIRALAALTPVALAGSGASITIARGYGRDVPRGRPGARSRDRRRRLIVWIRRGPRAPRVRGRSGGGGARRAGRRRPARGRAARSSR